MRDTAETPCSDRQDPLAPTDCRFPTARPQYTVPVSLAAPSDEARPFGLRFLTTIGTTSDVHPPFYRYDPARQLAIGADGEPLYRANRPRTTTGSSDGGSGPMEEWTYD